MNDRQVLETIMDALDLQYLKPKVRDVAEQNEFSALTMLKVLIVQGCHAEQARIDVVGEQKKERSKERKTIYNKKEKETTEKSTLPDLKIDVVKTSASKGIKKKMPKSWVDAYDRQKIENQGLIDYCKQRHGLDEHYAKTQFLAFVEWHMSKGSVFVRWNYAFYKWVNKDLAWNGKPATHLRGSMVQSYQNKNAIGELFND
jgi:hypothetical protein